MNKYDEVAALVEDYCDGNLDAEQQRDVEQKIQQCSSFKEAYECQLQYLALMSEQQSEVPPLSNYDVGKMVNHVVSSGTNNNGSFWRGFAAASVLAASLYSMPMLFVDTPAPLLLSQGIIDTEVTLVIDSPEDIANAEFTIELPERIALQGYDEFDELNWVLDFSKGKNAISLPIQIAAGIDLSEPVLIKAVIDNGEEQRSFELSIDLIENETAYIQENKRPLV